MCLDTDWSGEHIGQSELREVAMVGEVRHSPGAASDSPQPIN